MPRTIWKFVVTPGKPIMMPEGKLLSAHAQGEDICVWAEVDPATPLREKFIYVYATGQTLPYAAGQFLGTVLLRGGSLVFHVYDGR